MRLYEVTLLEDAETWPKYTRYFTSLTDAKRFRTKHRKNYEVIIKTCRVPDRLTIEQWVQLLESDAPGNQNFCLAIGELKSYEDT